MFIQGHREGIMDRWHDGLGVFIKGVARGAVGFLGTQCSVLFNSGTVGVAGFARATPPQEGIIQETPKSTQPSPKAKL